MSICNVLLISEDEVKELTDLTKNVDASKYCHHIPTAQDQKIKNAMGQKLYKEILDAVETTSVTPDQNDLINGNQKDYLGVKPAIAWWTLYYAYDNIYSTLTPTSIHVKGNTDQVAVEPKTMYQRKRNAKVWAEHYTDQIIRYLCDNDDLFPSFRESDTYSDTIERDGFGTSGIVIDDYYHKKYGSYYPYGYCERCRYSHCTC